MFNMSRTLNNSVIGTQGCIYRHPALRNLDRTNYCLDSMVIRPQSDVNRGINFIYSQMHYLYMVKKLSNQQIEEMTQLYSNGESSHSLSRRYDISSAAICGLLKRRNIKRRDASHSRQEYRINENYFENIDTEEKAYWFGFLMADGYLSKRNELSLRLAVKDKNHLEKFKKSMQSKHPIKEYHYENTSHMASFVFKNKKIHSDLIILGFGNKNKLPQVSKEMLHHFVRGMFDGDGSVSNSKNPSFSLLGEIELIKSIQNILLSYGLNRTKLEKRHPEGDGNVIALRYCGKGNILKLYKFLYQNATIFLERKKDKFEGIICA